MFLGHPSASTLRSIVRLIFWKGINMTVIMARAILCMEGSPLGAPTPLVSVFGVEKTSESLAWGVYISNKGG